MTTLVPANNKSPAIEGGTGEGCQFLTFKLGGEMLAIEIFNIKEIIEYGSQAAVPLMPELLSWCPDSY